MSAEFTIHDLGGVDDIELLIRLTGASEKGESFKLYMSKDQRGNPVGGVVRLEGQDGRGLDVGRVNMSCSSFSRPSLVLTTFNSDAQLTARLLYLAADEKVRWKLRHEMERADYEAKKETEA